MDTTLVLLAGAAVWTGFIAWVAHRWKTGLEARERERSMRYEQLIGPALVGGATGLSGSGTSASAAGTREGAAATALAGDASATDPARLAEALRSAARGAAPPSGLHSFARTSAALMPDAAILRAPPLQLRDRLLDKPATLALYAIRAAMPDHEVFVRVSLADLVDLPDNVHGYDRAQRLKRLASVTFDYVLASKAMQVVALIDLEHSHPTAEQRELQRMKAEYLRALPVRHLTFSRACLPKYPEIRARLQGAH
jgi:hypothetical protein